MIFFFLRYFTCKNYQISRVNKIAFKVMIIVILFNDLLISIVLLYINKKSMKVFKIFCSVVLLLPVFSGITSSMVAYDYDVGEKDFPGTVFERTEKQISAMQNPENSTNGNSWNVLNIQSVLEAEQQGGFSLFSDSNEISGSLDILTGKSSMNDSMQLGDFSSGLENKEEFLENIRKSIEAYKVNSDEKEYPESLKDFAKYNESNHLWAKIRMGDWNTPRKNISEISELFEYNLDTVIFKDSYGREYKKEEFTNLSEISDREMLKIAQKIKQDKKIPSYFSYVSVDKKDKENNRKVLRNFYILEGVLGEKFLTEIQRKSVHDEEFYSEKILTNYREDGNIKIQELSFNYEYNDISFRSRLLGMVYIKTINPESTFSLSLKSQRFNTEISDVKTVETKSHDFEELLEELDEEENPLPEEEGAIPEIYSLIPADTFSVYFSDPQKYREFSETLSNPLSEISQVLPLPSVSKMEEMIGKRLKIGDPKKFLGAVTEFAFVGDDIRIFPSSDFALIFKCKSDLACKIFGAEKVGDFFVLASDEKILEKIQKNNVGNAHLRSLREEKDFQYSWAVTENRRDGFIFFSDAFIRKMVSPEYRIKLRRQKSVIEAMNAVQYVIWVYKKDQKKFPENLQELEEKKYISENSIYELEKYSVNPHTGIISHEIWGTPFNITPLTRVKIQKISKGEKNWYETGIDEYQSNYQEFFDPIGVSITVADKIAFHTVILPLSQNKDYALLKTIGGGISKENFDLAGKYPTAMKGIMSFDIDEILYTIEDRKNKAILDVLNNKKKKSECFNELGSEKVCAKLFSPEVSDREKIIIAKEQEMWREISDDLSIDWENSDERIFDFLGDEIMLGFGENIVFDFDAYDTSGLDIFLTLKLNNSEKAETFFLALGKSIAKEMQGKRGFGSFFQINKPIKNTWGTGKNAKKYYSIPLGFMNIFVFFDEDRVSFSVSQNTIHTMIEGMSLEKKSEISGKPYNFSRLHTFLSGEKNILLTADTKKIAHWLENIPQEMKQQFKEEIMSQIFTLDYINNNSYEAEYFLLSEILGEKFMTEKFSSYPERLGYKAAFKKDTHTNIPQIFWKNINTGEEFSGENSEIFEQELAKINILEKIQKFLSAYGETGLSFAFTKHGAEIKIAFDNASNSQIDDRFESEEIDTIENIFSEFSDTHKIFMGGLGVIAMLGVLYILE